MNMLINNYHPRKYSFPIDDEDLDVDDTNDGDFIVCPLHEDLIIYVFGTHFWRPEWGQGFGWSEFE